jgi:AICAR transformylase/IMP cyclohydrolase PurH
MSEAKLKKELTKLTKDQLVQQILDLYNKNNTVKEFYDFYLNPLNENELVEKYKKLIRKEFNVERPERGSEKFSVAKKAISDFKNLQSSPEALADVMLYLPESACELTYCYGDYSEQFYDSAYNNYKAALEFMAKNKLLNEFRSRAEQCVKWASPCGYGFADEIAQTFYDYYGDQIFTASEY